MSARVRLAVSALVLLALAAWIRLGPIDPALLDDSAATSTVVVDRRGVVLYEALSGDGTRSVTLAPDALPAAIVAATLAAEDRRFWSHPGVDPIAIARAMKTNLTRLRVVEGGSTITQQLAKLLLNRRDPGRRRGWIAKAHEAVLALRLDHRFSKQEVVAMYLTLAAYGNQITGVERASQVYFGTTAAQLTTAQAAFLAGLPQRPTGFNPYRHKDAALARQRVVLRRMETAAAITAEQARDASGERLEFARSPSPFTAPHFVEMVLAAGGESRPARVQTTLDAALQSHVTGIVERHRPILDRHGARNVAVVVLDNRTGEWLAWEGSGDYTDADHGGAINGPVMPRQPGSALKPFTYALAFESGYTPASVLADIPSSFPTAEPGVVYSPRNYDGRFRGPLRARQALAGSENVPAVSLAATLGVPTLLRFYERAGLTTFDRTASHYGLGLTLGNAEVRLDDLVSAYAAFARGGEWIAPSSIRSPTPITRQVVSTRTAFWITDILSDPDAREYIFGRGGSLEFPFQVAVKTGTSQAYHDNWTVGYSRHVTVGVWVGNFDRTPLRNSTGVTGAGPIFHAVMLAAERHVAGTIAPSDATISAVPADAREQPICALSGMTANAWCPTKRREWVAAEAAALSCSWHHLADEGLLTILPAEYQAWAGTASRVVTTPPAVNTIAPRAASRSAAAALTIVSPADGATYSIDPTLRREFQTLSLKAAGAARGRVEWRVNGRALGYGDSGTGLEWPLAPGRHQIDARDSRGSVARTTIVVR